MNQKGGILVSIKGNNYDITIPDNLIITASVVESIIIFLYS
jgi:hypothetical protein